jgi:hypothetical protein
MTSTNGSKTPVERVLEQVDVLDADECERVKAKLVALEHERLVREVEHQRELDKLANRRRSTMTAREKSDYMTKHGIDAYNSLPWN